jgi:hypothetical protein
MSSENILKKLTREEAEQIVDTIDEKRLFNTDEISQYVEATGKINTKEDMVTLLTSIIENDDSYNFFLEEKLSECASKSDEYLNLILKAARLDQHFYSLSALVKVGNVDQEIADFLYDKLKKIKEERVAVATGYILGGVGQVCPTKVFKIIESNKNPTTEEQISYALALRVASENQSIPRKFVDLIMSYSDSDNWRLYDLSIRTMLWHHCNLKKVQIKLKSLIKRDDVKTVTVCNSIAPMIKKNKELAMEFLVYASNTNNVDVKRTMQTPLGILAPHFPLQCLKIAKKWSGNRDFHAYHDWYLREIGKGDTSQIKNFLLDWIKQEKNYLVIRFEIPSIVSHIYENKENELLDLIKSINNHTKTGRKIVVKILEDYLSKGFRKIRRSDSFIDECYNIVFRIADENGFETNPDSSLNTTYMKTLAIIDEIDRGEKKPNSIKVKKNLKYFPKLVAFLGQKNVERLIDTKSTHPLVQILARVNVSKKKIQKIIERINNESDPFRKAFLYRFLTNRFYPSIYLKEIESSLSLFDPQESGMPRMKRGLLSKEEFFDTIAELNIASRFKKKFPVMLQPRFGNNILDMNVSIVGRDHLVEVYAPDTDIRLKYIKTAHGMGNKAKKVILEKLENQLKSAASQNKPIILIVDKSRGMDVDEIEIEDALQGSLSFTLVFDNKTGKTVDEYASRKNDSISELSPYGKILSAVALVKYEMGDDLKIRCYGKLFLNPHAEIQFDEKTVKTLEETIFGD